MNIEGKLSAPDLLHNIEHGRVVGASVHAESVEVETAGGRPYGSGEIKMVRNQYN
jgi:hypothetical protein